MTMLINPFALAVPGGSGASTRWRLFLRQNGSRGVYILGEIEMRGTVGGANLCTGGTPTASSANGSYPASNAFDGNTATGWVSAVSGSGEWVEYAFASPVTIDEIFVAVGGGSGSFGLDWLDLQYYDGSTWVTKWTIFTYGWANNTSKTFNASTANVYAGDYTTHLGSEIVGDPGFDDAAYWTLSGGWSVSGSNLVGSGAASSCTRSGVFTSGVPHIITLPYVKTSGQKLRITDGTRTTVSENMGASGSLLFAFIPSGTELRVQADSATFTGTCSGISVKAIT